MSGPCRSGDGQPWVGVRVAAGRSGVGPWPDPGRPGVGRGSPGARLRSMCAGASAASLDRPPTPEDAAAGRQATASNRAAVQKPELGSYPSQSAYGCACPAITPESVADLGFAAAAARTQWSRKPV